MNFSNQRPQIMGILNITPDSFSDGGKYLDMDAAINHGIKMAEEGADIIDIGGESTRPGAKRMPASIQIERVVPVIKVLKERLSQDIILSIDTTLSKVAYEAVNAGASMINDISAGLDDEEIFDVAAKNNIPLVLMHMQGTPENMQSNPRYTSVISEILEFLISKIEIARETGIQKHNIIIDPGIGFGKSIDHNLDIIKNLDKLVQTGYRVLLGASRKKFLQSICNTDEKSELVGATCAMTAMGVTAGVHIFRVHDVRENRQVADLIYKVGAPYYPTAC
jgi:dihydropteroate synthase